MEFLHVRNFFRKYPGVGIVIPEGEIVEISIISIRNLTQVNSLMSA